MSKSYVGMGSEVCAICGNPHTETVLLDRRLRDTFENGKTVCTGNQPCSECQTKLDEGYVALVEVDEEKSGAVHKDLLMPGDAYRTGNISWLRSKAWAQVFNVPLPDPPLCFVGADVTAKLQSIAPPEASSD